MELAETLEVTRRNIFLTLRVEAREIKSIFQELSSLFKKTSSSKSLVIKCVNNTLMFRASSTVEWVAYPTNLSGECEDFEIACLFKDIHELIDSHGEIGLTITPSYVDLNQRDSVISLMVVDFTIVNLPRIEDVGAEIKTSEIISALRTLLKLVPASSVYQKSTTILLSGDIAQVRFPSIWLEASSKGLELPIDTNIANVLLNFLSSTETAFLLQLPQWTAITKGISTLFIPIKDELNLKSIDELTKDYGYIGEFSFRGLQSEIQKLIKAVGKADCKVLLFENEVKVEVRTENIQVSHSTGKSEEKLLDSFMIRLEFLNAILLTLGELVQVYGKGDYRCIKAARVRVLISSHG